MTRRDIGVATIYGCIGFVLALSILTHDMRMIGMTVMVGVVVSIIRADYRSLFVSLMITFALIDILRR